jgi:protein-tyrosine phosphatase
MSVPKSPKDFKALVAWTKTQLEEGKKVHCGCVGGHGRTGTFLAALCSEFGEKDAVTYVRQNYCKNVVEQPADPVPLRAFRGRAGQGSQDWFPV